MSAETLRKAASLMRERAEAAWPSEQWSRQKYANDLPENLSLQRSRYVRVVTYCGTRENADHIASWHPTVALAVADLLAGSADRWDAGDLGPDEWDELTAVATTYLGGDA